MVTRAEFILAHGGVDERLSSLDMRAFMISLLREKPSVTMRAASLDLYAAASESGSARPRIGPPSRLQQQTSGVSSVANRDSSAPESSPLGKVTGDSIMVSIQDLDDGASDAASQLGAAGASQAGGQRVDRSLMDEVRLALWLASRCARRLRRWCQESGRERN